MRKPALDGKTASAGTANNQDDDFQIATEAHGELHGFVFDNKWQLDADAVRLGRIDHINCSQQDRPYNDS